MSEFSASYHLRTNDREAAAALLQDSGNHGFIFPVENGWVSFVVTGPPFDINDEVINWNPGILLHYIYAEDHGWELKIWSKDELVFDYQCDWTDELRIEKSRFDPYLLRELIIQQGNSADDMEAVFDLKQHYAIFGNEPPPYVLAQRLGLTHYEWISSDYVDGERYPEAIQV
ncbi:hypothetical protein [Paenibacillus mucilaginosus]|uniref:Uncharacterized protein n=1 Tax=Paenibacillus mucilaginosus (strain KNP414) TaxID=1036673 RepID=F8F6V0_PAEMK|nr:hypothetical protein [Paenibacillus mucilaginosus]AEI43616.1 hypothetical protein KNP414_05092 [Paenibacillus mucilaginosus KNP414]MCG7216734.1 hypothetical protein [Paenibacillus mucilaginosus]WDM25150.1 hypothetical protein KCX80_22080 [Paenibacillus mucilaginosus]